MDGVITLGVCMVCLLSGCHGLGGNCTTLPCPSGEVCSGTLCVCDGGYVNNSDNTACIAAWGEWSAYTSCSVSCGSGTKYRTRTCSVAGQCVGSSTEQISCNEGNCPDPCAGIICHNSGRCSGGICFCVSGYTGTFCAGAPLGGSCAVSGSSCNDPNASCQSAICQCIPGYYDSNGIGSEGTRTQISWGEWSSYSSCTVTCGGGTHTRTRTCSVQGACAGSATEQTSCNAGTCPAWGEWSAYTSCSVSCGSGTQIRTRTCSVAGQCAGSPTEQISCNAGNCPDPCAGIICLNSGSCSGGICTCVSGYTGIFCAGAPLGGSCAVSGSSCNDPNGSCQSAICQCIPGYYDSNGISSEGICTKKKLLDESCIATSNIPDTATCADPNARCQWINNGYKCQCLSTYYDSDGTSNTGGTCTQKKLLDEACTVTSNIPDTATCADTNARCQPTNVGYQCQCLNTHYDSDGTSNTGGTCTPRKNRPTVLITDVQAKSLTVTWVVEGLQPDQTTLFTVNLKTDRPAMDIVKTLKGFNVSALVVKDLEEYWNYTVTLEMSTTAGAFISEPLTIRTLQSAPGPVSDCVVITNANGNYRDTVITWKAPTILEINGIIIRYAFTSNATINETTYLDAVLAIDHTYAVSVDVTPDQVYLFQVYAINSLDQKGTVTTKEIYAPAGIPPNTIEDVEGKDVISTVHDVSQTKFTVSLVKEFFQQSQHGVIRATGLIVCAKDKCDIGASLCLHQFTAMKSWQIASKEGFPAYRVTRDNWLTEAQDTTRQNRRRRRSLTIFDFVIGAEECTNTAYTDFCNGRLQPNLEYIIIATACTSGGCLLSKHYGPFKTLEEMKCPESSSSTAAIIIGVVMGVIILVLATYAAYVTIQNRKYKAKKDTAPGTKSRAQTFSSPIYINEKFTDSNEQRLSRPKEDSSANEDSQYSSLDETRTERLTYETLHAF